MTIFYTVLKRLIPFFQGEKIVETEQGSCCCCYSYLLWRQARSTHGIRGDSRAAACICGEGTAFVSGEACCLQTQCWRQPVLQAAPQPLLWCQCCHHDSASSLTLPLSLTCTNAWMTFIAPLPVTLPLCRTMPSESWWLSEPLVASKEAREWHQVTVFWKVLLEVAVVLSAKTPEQALTELLPGLEAKTPPDWVQFTSLLINSDEAN